MERKWPECAGCKEKGKKTTNARLVVYRRPDFYLCSLCAGDKSVDDVDKWLRERRKA